MEAHEPIELNKKKQGINLTPVISGAVQAGVKKLTSEEWQHIVELAGRHTGVPVAISQSGTSNKVSQKTPVQKTLVLTTAISKRNDTN